MISAPGWDPRPHHGCRRCLCRDIQSRQSWPACVHKSQIVCPPHQTSVEYLVSCRHPRRRHVAVRPRCRLEHRRQSDRRGSAQPGCSCRGASLRSGTRHFHPIRSRQPEFHFHPTTESWHPRRARAQRFPQNNPPHAWKAARGQKSPHLDIHQSCIPRRHHPISTGLGRFGHRDSELRRRARRRSSRPCLIHPASHPDVPP